MLWRDGNPDLLRYLRVAAPEAAEDVAAEVWVQVCRGLAGFRGDERAWRSWLFTIARRRAIDEGRRRSRHPVAPLGDVPRGREPRAADAEALALENLATAAVIEAVAALPPLQAEVIVLRMLAGLDNQAVARIVGRSPGAVRVRRPPGPAPPGPDPVPGGSNAMTGGGACGGDMPAFPSPAPGEIPPVGDPAYDALLARALPPGDAPAGLGLVAGAFAALRAAPADSAMSAEASALAAFRGAAAGQLNPPARAAGGTPCPHRCSAPSWPRSPRPRP